MTNTFKLSFDDFKKIYDQIEGEPEFEITFNDKNAEYMIIKYANYATFQRCGYSDEGSGEIKYISLDDIYNSELIDGISLKRDWGKITDIVIDGTFIVSRDLDEILDKFHIKL